jgi:hypothetical protein
MHSKRHTHVVHIAPLKVLDLNISQAFIWTLRVTRYHWHNLVAIVLWGILEQIPRPAPRRQTDDLPDWLKGSATFDEGRSSLTGGPIVHTGYYYTKYNRTHQVKLYKYNRQIHWYELTYNRLWSCYKVDADNQIDINNPYLRYFAITDPWHVDYIPETEEFHEPEPAEEFLARGIHHIATLQGPQAQLSPTHLVLPVIEQAAAQGEEIPVDVQPIASTSAVIIQNPAPPPPIVIQPTMAQAGGAQI